MQAMLLRKLSIRFPRSLQACLPPRTTLCRCIRLHQPSGNAHLKPRCCVRCCVVFAGGQAESRMCSLTKHGKVYVLELVGADDHRLSPSTFSEILGHLEKVNSAEDAGALVTTNQGKFYSNGLDLEWVKEDPRERGPALYKQFEELLLALMSMKVPTIAAICGHAAAGGLILAMAHDHRFMRADRGFLYSSAIDINVAIPAGSLALLQSKVAPRVYRDAVLKCVKYTGKMALQDGLIDVLCDDSATTLQEALKEAQALADRNWDRNVYQAMRKAMYPHVLDGLQGRDSELFVPVAPILKS